MILNEAVQRGAVKHKVGEYPVVILTRDKEYDDPASVLLMITSMNGIVLSYVIDDDLNEVQWTIAVPHDKLPELESFAAAPN